MKRKKNTSKKGISKKLVEKAGMAIKHEFYLEASWILTSIFERKLNKILEKMLPQAQKQGLTFTQLINRVRNLNISGKHPDFSAYMKIGLLDDIRTWKNQRNDVLKDIPDTHVSQARLERLATEGIRLLKELNKATRSIKSADNLTDSAAENQG
ncbi:MAG: hypothetical protein Q8M08_10665 [Bacteroidales bacterium]|nr:hypothetical protein [Bacteroidales bacterium]